MANFCNKCGAPVSGIFCVKCGYDTRLTGTPVPPASAPQDPPPAPVSTPTPAASVPVGAPAAKFCNKCGAPSIGAPFCNKCGANLREGAAPALQPAAIPAAAAPPPPVTPLPSQTMPAPQAQAKGSPLTKILVGFAVVVITVGALAAGGVYYVVYRVKQKVHEVARDAGLGSSSENNSSSSGGIMGSISKMVSGSSNNDGRGSGSSTNIGAISGDPCRLLSKEEVSNAIGVEIVATERSPTGCSYLAHGDPADMAAKHMAAMAGTKGADAKTQQMVQTLTGGLAKMVQDETHGTTMDSNGNVPVFVFGVDNTAAEAQMRLNAKVMGRLGPGQVSIPGIGDEAMDESSAMMMVRKGDKLISIGYSTCPCSVDAIKPLARMLADRV